MTSFSPDSGAPRLLAALERLAVRPPQVLLLEGGNEASRLSHALYWAKAVNCPGALAKKDSGKRFAPCGKCPVCQQIEANEYLDLKIYDGRITNKQDEEKPGPIRALNINNMRELKSISATAPHGAGKRVAIFQGMTQTREEALNSLLKTLEEPSLYTLFVLLAPQRQQILPTLVSRSFTLTLPWPDCLATDSNISDWESALARFLENGATFLERASAKGALEAPQAAQLLLACQRSICRIAAKKLDANNPLDKVLENVSHSPQMLATLTRWLAEAQEMLNATVAPARVLEAFASRLFVLVRQRG